MSRFGCLILLMTAAVMLAGCKKAPPPTAESIASRRPPSPYANTPPPAIVIADSGDVNANLANLSQALRKYIAGSHRMPTNFDDFLAKSGVQPPPAPVGQKYVVQGQVIVLAKDK
jgi:hypothetical protein